MFEVKKKLQISFFFFFKSLRVGAPKTELFVGD